MGSEQMSKYNDRIRELQSKLMDETDNSKKIQIKYDIDILKLRVRIESIKSRKERMKK